MNASRKAPRTRARGSIERLSLDPQSPWWGEHRSRYRFARAYVENRRVLDIACGSGFGCRMLEEAGAHTVVGMDIEEDAVREARGAFESQVCHFLAGDGTALPFPDGTFDVVTSFETIEHIPAHRAFIRELRRVTVDGGRLILSTPNLKITSRYPRNPFHVHEFLPDELFHLLKEHYRIVEMRGQMVKPHFRVAPFLPGKEIANSAFDHVRLVAWKTANRFPFRIKNALARVVTGHPFYPAEDDFAFVPACDLAPVLVALSLT